MKIVSSYRLLLLWILVSVGTTVSAQVTDTAKSFIDSASTPAPVVDTTVASIETTDESSKDEALPDSAVVSVYRSIGDDTLQSIKKDKGFYYQTWLDSLLRAKAIAKEKDDERIRLGKKRSGKKGDGDDEDEQNDGINTKRINLALGGFQVVLAVIALAVLVFVIYKLSSGRNALLARSKKNIEAVVDKEEEVFDGKYEGLIRKAEAENNFRLAVRYCYLQALYNLSEKEYVRLATEKTNYQYLNELRSKSAPLTNLFAALTYKYDYIWYGEYTISNLQYDSLKGEFTEFNKELDKR